MVVVGMCFFLQMAPHLRAPYTLGLYDEGISGGMHILK